MTSGKSSSKSQRSQQDGSKQSTEQEKEPYDNYPTPTRLAKACIKYIKEKLFQDFNGLLIEPSAGSGAFVREMRAAWPDAAGLWAIEIRPEHGNLLAAGANSVVQADWVQWARWMGANNHFQSFEHLPILLCGNPPFSQAQAHLEETFKVFKAGTQVAFLLRFSFFGGKERNQTFWLKDGGKFLKYVIPIAPRPSFVKGTSDNSEYAIFIWQVGWNGPATILSPILWEKRDRKVIEDCGCSADVEPHQHILGD